MLGKLLVFAGWSENGTFKLEFQPESELVAALKKRIDCLEMEVGRLNRILAQREGRS